MKVFKQHVVLVLALFVGLNSFAQVQWEKTYGAWGIDKAEAVIPTSDSGYLVVGSTSSFHNQSQAYILKLNKLGDLLWTKNYGGQGIETAYDAVETPDSGFAVIGISDSYGKGYQGYLLRLDKSGDTVFTKTYGGNDWDFTYSITMLPDSGFILAGETFSNGAAKNDGYLIRIDKEGDTLWTNTYGGVEEDYFKKVLLSIDKELIVVGGSKSFGSGDEQGYLLKVALDGSVIFENNYGNTNDDYFVDVVEKANKNIIITGASQGTTAEMDFDAWSLRTTGAGIYTAETFWVNNNPGEFNMEATGIAHYANTDSITIAFKEVQLDTLNYVAGEIFDVSGSYALTSGTRFQKFVSSFDDVIVTDVDTTLDGGYIYACYGNGTIGNSGEKSIYIIKTNEQNQSGCSDTDFGCINHTNDVSAGFASLTEKETGSFNMYPNPVSRVGDLSVSNNNSSSLFTVYNMSGSIVWSTNLSSGNNKLTIDFLDAGAYIARISNTSGEITGSRQLIVLP